MRGAISGSGQIKLSAGSQSFKASFHQAAVLYLKVADDEHTASVDGAYRTTSDLTCALIEGETNNAFLMALPDGD